MTGISKAFSFRTSRTHQSDAGKDQAFFKMETVWSRQGSSGGGSSQRNRRQGAALLPVALDGAMGLDTLESEAAAVSMLFFCNPEAVEERWFKERGFHLIGARWAHRAVEDFTRVFQRLSHAWQRNTWRVRGTPQFSQTSHRRTPISREKR